MRIFVVGTPDADVVGMMHMGCNMANHDEDLQPTHTGGRMFDIATVSISKDVHAVVPAYV